MELLYPHLLMVIVISLNSYIHLTLGDYLINLSMFIMLLSYSQSYTLSRYSYYPQSNPLISISPSLKLSYFYTMDQLYACKTFQTQTI
jgi:hypothetical protein